jgi:hypothetical protein
VGGRQALAKSVNLNEAVFGPDDASCAAMNLDDARFRVPTLAALIVGTLVITGGACGNDKLGSGGSGGQGGGSPGGASGNAGGHRGAAGGGFINCWSGNDCAPAIQPSICVPPDNPYYPEVICGRCDPSFSAGCMSDGDCASDAGTLLVCEPTPCGCPGQECVPGCTTNADCPEELSCSASHHCVAPSCDVNAGPGCPSDFTCQPTGQCKRKSCATDGDCAVTCVNGACYSRSGKCSNQDI